MTVKVRRCAAGYYEVDTPTGTHTIRRLDITRDLEGWEHRRCGTYWFHTAPDEFNPSGDFRTLAEAVDYVREHHSGAPVPGTLVDPWTWVRRSSWTSRA